MFMRRVRVTEAPNCCPSSRTCSSRTVVPRAALGDPLQAAGRGRALGVGEVKFTGQVTPKISKVVYRIDLKRVIMRKLVLGVGDGAMEADGKLIYEAKDLKVGLFNAADLA